MRSLLRSTAAGAPATKRGSGHALIMIALCLSAVLAPLSPSHAASWNAADVLRDHLLRNYPWPEVRIADLQLLGPAPAAAPLAVTVEKSPPGRTDFTLLFANGKRIAGSAMVRTFDPVVLCRSSFAKGYLLAKDDVYSTLMETGRMPRDAVRDANGVAGRMLTRTVLPNVPLTEGMLAAGPLVRKGRVIVLEARRGGVMIRTGGELKHDAAVGSEVRAVNLQSKRTVTGLLVDEATVQVRL